MEWWSLPGPATFVDGIVSDLAQGCNVIIRMPHCAPNELRTELAQRTKRQGLQWENLFLEDMGEDEPLDYLYKELVGEEIPRRKRRSIADLISRNEFGGQAFWLHDLDGSNWKGWMDFLDVYKNACRSIDQIHRCVFCLCWTGRVPGKLPREDVCLRIRDFDDTVSPLDMLLYVQTNLPHEKMNSILRNLKTEVVASLAQWDSALAENLMGISLEALLDVCDYLKELAREWGWDRYIEEGREAEWAEGMYQLVAGKQVMHSCWCAIKDPFEVKRRIWQSQLRVLYPFLEEQRLAIVQRIKPKHILPFEDNFGTRINDPNDLEIGHIEHLIRTRALTKYDHLLTRVSDLKVIRNQLAHRKIVNESYLQSQAVLEPLE